MREGKNLFQYTDVCDYNITWDQDKDYITNPSDVQIDEFIPLTNYSKYYLDSYNTFSLNTDSSGIDHILFLNDASFNQDDNNVKYAVTIGTYVIMNVPESHAIAFLNEGVENLFSYDGFYPHKITSTGPDGKLHDFYYGNINFYVSGNFGTISFYTLNNGLLNGRRKMIFDSFANTGYALPGYGLSSNFPLLNIFDDINVERKVFNVSVIEYKRILPYSNPIPYFRFEGEDRQGKINSTENIPTLKFFTGDIVYFNFKYNNSFNVFGIYENSILLTDLEVIVNNNNTTSTSIKWTPTIPSTTFYYYRSSLDPNLVYNNIQITNNDNIDLNPKFNSIVPSSGSFIDPQISEFKLLFDETVYVNKNKNIYIKDNNDIISYTYSSNDLIRNNNRTYTLKTNFKISDRLEFTKL